MKEQDHNSTRSAAADCSQAPRSQASPEVDAPRRSQARRRFGWKHTKTALVVRLPLYVLAIYLVSPIAGLIEAYAEVRSTIAEWKKVWGKMKWTPWESPESGGEARTGAGPGNDPALGREPESRDRPATIRLWGGSPRAATDPQLSSLNRPQQPLVQPFPINPDENEPMNAYKINDDEIYAAHDEAGAIACWKSDTGFTWDDECEIERMSPEDPWRDEATPEVEETIGDVLARTAKEGFIGAVG